MKMQCIHFGDGDKCYANPPIPAVAGRYKPEETIKTKYCQNENFMDCPRYRATNEYFKAYCHK